MQQSAIVARPRQASILPDSRYDFIFDVNSSASSSMIDQRNKDGYKSMDPQRTQTAVEMLTGVAGTICIQARPPN
jgi:hypothetical protein